MYRRPIDHAKRVVTLAVVIVAMVQASSTRLIGATIVVRAGGDLQAALDQAQTGDVIVLEAGATFTGNFVLRAKSGTRPITLRSSGDERRLPGVSERVGPEHAPALAKLKSPNTGPVLATAPNASHWRLVALEFVGSGTGDIITLGDGSSAQNSLDEVPSDLVLDRVLVRGDQAKGQKRGIALNSASTTIRNSYISEIKGVGLESQAIAGWNGPGPYVIENNHIEAAGIGLLFGGADPGIKDVVPSDITIRRNLFTKDLSWRGSSWTVKNLLELKTARRVRIEGNRLENCWSAAQPGYAVLFTVRNTGRTPWATIEDVVFRNNIVSHSAGGLNVLGTDSNFPSLTATNIAIENNLFEDINHKRWGGNGLFLQIGNAPVQVTVDHNTVFHSGNVITAYGRSRGAIRPIPGFRFTNNVAAHNTYGIFGDGVGFGTPAINAYFPDSVIASNVLAGGQASRYPAGNFFPSLAQWTADFLDLARGNFRLAPRSPYRRAARDGKDLGVDFDELMSAMADPDR